MPDSSGLYLLSSKQQLFPVISCLFTTRSKMRSQFATCYSPGHLLAPSSTFTGQKGCRAAEGSDCSRQWEGSGKAAFQSGCWPLFHLAPPSLEDSLLPCQCWGQPCPVVLHTLLEGSPGKGNGKGKKAPRGSRRGAERDSSPFSFTLSFL